MAFVLTVEKRIGIFKHVFSCQGSKGVGKMSRFRSTAPPGVARRRKLVLGLALFVGLAGAASHVSLSDGVYSSGLFELGDGQAPPGMPGAADITASLDQTGPDWAELFNADGTARDDYPADDAGNPVGNGTPDYLELYGGRWAVFTDDYVSMGSGLDGTALYPDGRVYAATVAPENDLGNAFVYTTQDSQANTVLYAGVQRLGSGNSNLEIEFNQDHFRLGHGGFGKNVPFQVLGNRQDGDVLVKLAFVDGLLGGTEAKVWTSGTWVPLSSVSGEGCDEGETLCSVANATAIVGGPWNGGQQLAANSLVEMGINVGALVGTQPNFTTIRLRTPQDTAFGYFAEGN